MPKNKGATLIELLLSLAVGCVIFLALLGAITPLQTLTWDLSTLYDRDSTLCLAPLLLCKWIAGAGNNRAGQNWTGIQLDGDSLQAMSDTEGKKGFPDGHLNESYESIAVRRKGSDLQIKSKTGSFQPAFKNFTDFSADLADLPLLSLTIGTDVDAALIRMTKTAARQRVFKIYLWNYRPNLFEEIP